MLERSLRVAGLLRAEGLRAGDRVHVHLGNRPAFYDLWFGAAIAGTVIVPTNPLATADELRYVIDHAACALSITQPDLVGQVVEARAGAANGVFVADLEGGDVPHGARSLSSALQSLEPSEAAEFESVDGSAPLAILYTSGTTSRPKGVIVTHAAYIHVGDVVAGHLRLRPDDRQLIVLPLFHGNAQYYSTMSALVTGASIALVDRFSASRWSSQATVLGATVASLFAAPIRMILAQPPSPDDRAHALRVTLFAQNVTTAQLEAFEERFGSPLAQLYGMTETVVPPLMNPVYGERRNMTIGRPVLSARVRVVTPEGRDAGPGEVGELWVAGEPGRTLMAGYLDDPEATAAVLADGWLRTGDSVTVDAESYFAFVDRRKDLIKRAGENVSTGEVERVLESHPAVFEAAVIGVPDDMRDEAVKAVVVLKDGSTVAEKELIAWCGERLARFKVPSIVEVVESLPRTSVGKIQKHLLREVAASTQGT